MMIHLAVLTTKPTLNMDANTLYALHHQGCFDLHVLFIQRLIYRRCVFMDHFSLFFLSYLFKDAMVLLNIYSGGRLNRLSSASRGVRFISWRSDLYILR